MKVNEFHERLSRVLGDPGRSLNADILFAGDGEREVRKAALAMTATHAVVNKAIESGCDLLISHEPLYWDHFGNHDALKADPVYEAKRALVEGAGLSVIHLHDYLHMPGRDLIAKGMAEKLGWVARVTGTDLQHFSFADKGLSLDSLATDLARILSARNLRYVGKPDLVVKNLIASWGFNGRDQGRGFFSQALAESSATVLVIGETHEWELVEWARDAAEQGKPVGLVVVGHVDSEEEGVKAFMPVIKEILAPAEVIWIQTGSPFTK